MLVLHDLNLACRYADHIVAMKHGGVLAQGAPADIIDADIVTQVFGLPCVVVPEPISRTGPLRQPGPDATAWAPPRWSSAWSPWSWPC